MRLPLLPLLLLAPFFAKTQIGCTDAQAINYDPAATQNDGSCVYPQTFLPTSVKSTLADTLRENSGLIRADNRWWTLNDGGNDHTFFRSDPETGAVSQFVKLKQAENEDWEDLTTDGANLYIADVGNNNGGNRTDLGIYRVPIAKIGSGTTTSVDETEYTFLPFAYDDQTNFDAVAQDSTVFDCEALVFSEGKIRLFQKNWRDRSTTHYALNPAIGLAQKVETFDVGGLVTSAALAPDGKALALLGYNIAPPEVFLWLFWDFRDGLFFNGNKRRLELGSPLALGQSEAIAFSDNRTGYIGNERLMFNGFVIVPPQIRAFDIGQFIPEMVGASEGGQQAAGAGRVFPNPFAQSVQVQAFGGEQVDFLRVKNLLGQTIFAQNRPPAALDTSAWPPGQYIFEVGLRGKMVSFAGIKN